MDISANTETKTKKSWLRGLQDFVDALEHQEIDGVWEHLLALNNRVKELETRLQELEGPSVQAATQENPS